ncbi:MAG: PQQ-binding-like beta-propeller repeat protein [Candidatus Eisenbacteria bacterium]|nr:PQQ-binding-like beta-propeller repeat protein [Candidatus Eisenbacteria bacterium]
MSRINILIGVVVLGLLMLVASAASAAPAAGEVGTSYHWPMKHRDPQNTGRADFSIPLSRLNTRLFDVFSWQKPSPDSPVDGNFDATAMVFRAASGAAGEDVVLGTYHWPKGVQAMDRHTGRKLWNGLPGGGERIAETTPAFSNDGQTIYVVNDATESGEWPAGHPLMAFPTATGPATFRHNGADTEPNHLTQRDPLVAPDGRIFMHEWANRPFAATDDGGALTETWAAAEVNYVTRGGVAVHQDGDTLRVISAGEWGDVVCYDGETGAELWRVAMSTMNARPTIDPDNGNVYVPAGNDYVYIVGLDKRGNKLWADPQMPVYEWISGMNNPQWARNTGCLSVFGDTYYFQTNSEYGQGALYAINTSDGSVKWSYPTRAAGQEIPSSSPIVTRDGTVIVGNNEGRTYFAIRDDGAAGILIDSLVVESSACATATLSPEGLLYLPLRTWWVAGNGDGDIPTSTVQNLYTGIDLRAGAQPPLIPPPSSQRAFALDDAVRLRWKRVIDPAGQFCRYNIYRDTAPFDSVNGMTPIDSVTSIEGLEYADVTAMNGTSYHYAVTSLCKGGGENRTAPGVGPRTPFRREDLQVTHVERTPRWPRYVPTYQDQVVTEPSGYGPYIFSAAMGLGNGQDSGTKHLAVAGDTVRYEATVRNAGTTTWNGTLSGTWTVNGSVVSTPSAAVTLAPGDTAAFELERVYTGATESVSFAHGASDDRPGNNSLAVGGHSVGFLTFVDATFLENFRERTGLYPGARTDDLLDWLNRHMARFDSMFSQAGCDKRVHYEVLHVVDDTISDPQLDMSYFACFPFRYRATDGDVRDPGYYDASEDIDYGLLHEMGHQLGLIDLYRLNLDPSQNQVNGMGYSAPECLMNGCSHFLSPNSARGMTHWLDKAHGYFGQYMYDLPATVRLEIQDFSGEPLAGATVTLYQKESRIDVGEVISTQVKATGTTDASGRWTLPNVDIDTTRVPSTFAGDKLRPNPFGYYACVGFNGLFLVKVEKQGHADYAWLDVTEVNDAYRLGSHDTATFTRQVALGGGVELNPPTDMAEKNAASWARWSEGGSITLTDDLVRTVAGEGSVKMLTTGGFDNYIRYPGDRLSQWDLGGVQYVHAWFYVENGDTFQGGSPWIRMGDLNGYVELRSTMDTLNAAIGQWAEFNIPVAGSGNWTRTVVGSPDISKIHYLEIHSDTWGYGFSLWADAVRFDPQPTVVGVGEEDLPKVLALRQNAPNPFAGRTAIRFELPTAQQVKLEIYDVSGRMVRGLRNGSVRAGVHTAAWDGRDARGRALGSGMYFARLQAAGGTLVRKMTLLGR